MNKFTKRLVLYTVLGTFFAEIIAFVVIYLPFALVGMGFPEYVPVPSAQSTLTSLIQFTGILLGFSGVIFAQLFAALMNQQNSLYQAVLKEPESALRYTKVFKAYQTKKILLAILVGLTFLFLLGSIFLSISKTSYLSNITDDTIATFSSFYYQIAFMVGGAFLLVASLVVFPTNPPIESPQEQT